MNQITQFFVGTGTTESKLWGLQNWPRFGQVMKITIQKKITIRDPDPGTLNTDQRQTYIFLIQQTTIYGGVGTNEMSLLELLITDP